MSRNKLFVSVILLLMVAVIFLAVPMRVAAADPFVNSTTCYTDSGANQGNVCDKNDATIWFTGTAYPHFAVVNLSSSTKIITSVSVKWETASPDSGTIDIWNGAAWVTKATFTHPADNSNVSYTLSSPVATQKIRVFGTVGFSGSNFISIFEISAFGHVANSPAVCALNDQFPGMTTILQHLMSLGVVLVIIGAIVATRKMKAGTFHPAHMIYVLFGIFIIVVMVAALIGNLSC